MFLRTVVDIRSIISTSVVIILTPLIIATHHHRQQHHQHHRHCRDAYHQDHHHYAGEVRTHTPAAQSTHVAPLWRRPRLKARASRRFGPPLLAARPLAEDGSIPGKSL